MPVFAHTVCLASNDKNVQCLESKVNVTVYTHVRIFADLFLQVLPGRGGSNTTNSTSRMQKKKEIKIYKNHKSVKIPPHLYQQEQKQTNKQKTSIKEISI